MGDGGTGQGDGEHVLLGGFQALADCLGDLSSLAQAETDLALLVADDDQSGELHHTAALDGLGDTVQGNDFFHVLAGFSFKSRHFRFLLPLKFQAGLTGALCQGLHTAVYR